MKLIDVGFGNYVSAERIVTVASTDSLPVRRLVQDAKNDGRVIDVSCGQKTRAVPPFRGVYRACALLLPTLPH